MMNLKNADLTNPAQKGIAILIGGAILGLLYYLLPPLVFILKNIWLTVALGLPLLFLAYNYEILWSLLKQLSWNMTKKIISSNKLWYMWQGYNWLVARNEELNQSIQKVGEIYSKTNRKLVDLTKEIEATKQRALHEEKKNTSQIVLKVIYNKIALSTKQFDNLAPKLEFISNQKDGLIKLHENWVADAEILKQTLEAKEQDYELMKELSSASDTAMSFLKKDSPEMRDFNESLKQIEQSTNQYISNVENFQRNVLPTLQTMDTQRELNEEEGRRLIEEFKVKRLQM